MHLLQYNPRPPVTLEPSSENLDPNEIDTELEIDEGSDYESEYDYDSDSYLSDHDYSCRDCTKCAVFWLSALC